MNSPILFNPFEEDIVTEPRHREPAVPGLNERPFRELLGAFDRLDRAPTPRVATRLPHAILLTSPQPGYGKSHLVGRLLRELHGRATFVYLRPFRNPLLPFQSVLAAVVRELSFPDRLEKNATDASEPTQLDRFAHALFGHLVANLIGPNLDSSDPEGDMRLLREEPGKAFGFGSPHHAWANWMREHFETLVPLFENNLATVGAELHSTGILRALYAYAYAYADFDHDTRRTCLEWLAGHPLEAATAKDLGFRPSDVAEAEMPSQERNETCRQRLLDLCTLAAFFRPFVLCFDQTEVYGHHPDLARSFGMLVASLVNEATNQLTLVTSNQAPWVHSVRTHIEEADLNRFAPPLSMEGLTRIQAAELARLRLESRNVDSAEIGAFLSPAWLEKEFPSPTDQKAPRSFLRKCRDRWDQSDRKSEATRKPTTLGDFYTQRRENLLKKPKRRLFDADILQWLVADAAYGMQGLTVLTNPSGTYPVLWERGDRKTGFLFEDGTHPRRWDGIFQTAARRTEANPRFKTVCFRTPELKPVPDHRRQPEGKEHALHLVELCDRDLAELYAGYDLYADALQGNIPYSDREVVQFLQRRFESWWIRFADPAPQSKPAGELAAPGAPKTRERHRANY